MKIKISNLVFYGHHGLSKEERELKQPFRTDILIESLKSTVKNDEIKNTTDYRLIKKIIQETIEENQYKLIESIANEIASKVIKIPDIFSTTVKITKLKIWKNGLPGVEINRKLEYPVELMDFDIDNTVFELTRKGAASIPLISRKRLEKLLKEAEKYTYIEQPKIVGPNKVREETSSFSEIQKESLFTELVNDFSELLNYKLRMAKTDPFKNEITFNRMVLQKYKKGSFGISPHLDESFNINLIAIFILKGKGNFGLCENREKLNPVYFNARPGDVILMRAPGFFGSNKRPLHFVENITEDRITFGLRQNEKRCVN